MASVCQYTRRNAQKTLKFRPTNYTGVGVIDTQITVTLILFGSRQRLGDTVRITLILALVKQTNL